MLGLLSKTITATLPAALLVIFWWQRGRLSWRQDVRPLLPFFVLGVAAGLLTAWVERTLIGAEGADFELSLVQRCLLAGRVVWFYLEKLLWPRELAFIYPRWHLSPAVWWQYLFPAAVLLVLAGLWWLRRRWRGPLAGALFFVGTLFPALGFCNVYPFLFSLVADHFQYLASLGVISLGAAGIALLLQRWALWRRPAGYAACLALFGTLGTLTWRQSQMYSDPAMLYQVTIDKNPECAMAHCNLGSILQRQGNIAEALIHYHKALAAAPRNATLHNNIGAALAGCGRLDEAMQLYQKALEIKPDYGEVYSNRGAALLSRGRPEEAMSDLQKAVELGARLRRRPGQSRVPVDQSRPVRRGDRSLSAGAGNPARSSRGQRGPRHRPAAAKDRRADPAVAASRGRSAGRRQGAQRLGQGPGDAGAAGRGRRADFRRALELRPDDPEAHYHLAWLRATCAEPSLRNGAEALALARRAIELTGGRSPVMFAALAAAHAESGQFPEAVAAARQGITLAMQQNNPAVATRLRMQLSLYAAGKPVRQTPLVSLPQPKP